MRPRSLLPAICCLTALSLGFLSFVAHAQTQGPSDDYPLGPDAKPQPSAPAGKTFQFDIADSKVFPDSRHTITVYVPAAYHPAKPACVYVGFDGLGFNAPVVFDNLIAKQAMPVTIGIGISSGQVDSSQPPENPRFDRSFEFDSLTDRLARFVLDEVLPAVEKHSTPDGKPIRLSKNPNDRAAAGGSTGGIAAFTLAWQRPDEFRRVFTAIGTFVGMRGAEQYYVLVRKTEPKPLRIFMQDGEYDEWGGGPEVGDWWMSNQTMERALSFAGYDVRHVWGTGTHNGNHAASLFPEVMRWLWRDWPAPITSRPAGNPVLQEVLQEGSAWEAAAKSCGDPLFIAASSAGQLFAASAGSPLQISLTAAGGQEPQPCQHSEASRPFAFTPDEHVVSAPKEERVLGNHLRVNGLTVRSDGDVYLTAETPRGEGQIWRISPRRGKTQLDKGLDPVSGLAFSPDGLWLMVARSQSHLAYSYRVRSDGTLDARAPFYAVATLPGDASSSRAGSIWMDVNGRPYMATDLGVQIFDRNGRVTAILPLPDHAPVTGISFGGKDWKTLYAAAGGTVYSRRMKVAGAPPGAPAIKLPNWGPG